MLFSGSESLFNNPFAAVTFKATSSSTEFVSATATGESLIGLTVMSNLAVAVKIPSEIV